MKTQFLKCLSLLFLSSIQFSAPLSFAKNKTEVWVYTSLYKEVLEEMNPLLQKALPDIEVKWFQGGSETIASKVNAEIAAGGSQAHLVLTSDPFWYYELKVNGHLKAYPGPAYNPPIAPEFSDPENFYRAIRLPVMVIGYHPEHIKKETLPEKWSDLTEPKWKNLLAMPSPLESGTSFTTVALLSQKLGWDFFYGLQKNNILAAGGNSSVLNRIETGERPIGILLLENILKAQKKGSPIRPHYVQDGVIPMSSPIALLNNPKNSEAAKKVYDWFYTNEAQIPIINSGMFSLIPNSPTPEHSKSFSELKVQMIPWNPTLLEELYKNRHEIKNKFTQIIFHQKTKEDIELTSKSHSKNLIIEATLRSLALSFFVALFSGFLGFTLAWIVTRTYFPGRHFLSGLLAVPYILPAYLLGMAWIVLANPTVGLLKNFIPGSQGSYGFWAMVFVETCVAFTFPFLELKASFNRMNPSLEEAARMSGANPFQTLRDIGLPLLWPSLVNGMCLAFLYTLSSFGVPALLGLPVREFVLTTLIYSQFKLGGSEGLAMGLWLSMLLLSIVCIILLFSYFLTRAQRNKNLTIVGSKSSRPSLAHLGKLTWPIFIFSWGFLFIAVFVPWVGLGLSALAPVAGQYSPMDWTIKNILTVLSLTEFKQALVNSLTLSFMVSFIIIFSGFILAYFAARKKSKTAKLLIEIQSIPFATPGIVLGVFMIFLSTYWNASVFKVESLLFWMGLGYALKYSALGAKMQLTAFSQVDPVLEEAARMSGARSFYILKDIWLPLLKKTIFAVFLLSLLPMLTELAISTLLTGPGAATLGTVLFQLQEYSDQSSAAALAWILLSLALFLSLLSSLTLQNEDS